MTVVEVEAVAKAFHDGVANQDAAALASLYAENARFLPPGMEPREGRAQIQSAMQQLLDMGARELDLEPLDVSESGDLAIEYGRYRLRVEPAGTEGMTDIGKYIVVHQRQADGPAKIVYDIFNSNAPAG